MVFMETATLDPTTFSGVVDQVMTFATGLIPVLIPLVVISVGIPLAVRLFKRFSR